MLKKLFKDIARRCRLPVPGIDLLHFLKCTALPGLFGEQFFRALDEDGDGRLSQTEFVTGVMKLYRGSYSELAHLIFQVIDFNHKGFIIPEEMKLLYQYLPVACLRCGAKIVRNWDLEPKLKSVFGANAVLSFEDVLASLERQQDFFEDILQALLTSLPRVIDETFEWGGSCLAQRCNEAQSNTLKPLKFQGRRYLFDLHHQALYCYTSIDRSSVKNIILLKGLFLEPLGSLEFALKTIRFQYIFEASSELERDEWVSRILEVTGYRWFDDYYETGEVLGEGANGQVLKAKHRITKMEAAVKIINKEGMDEKNEFRLRREIDVLKIVKHDNLLELYDVFETNDRIYLVTELVSGGTLFNWLEKQHFKVSEENARAIVSDLARALQYLHARGIVHRDIKLENVLLTTTGKRIHAKLIDFGLSTFLGPGEHSEEPVGTLKYVSPEVISRLQYNEKVDSWSLGVVIYVLLHGTTPFFGKTDEEVALRILKKRLSFDSDTWTDVSEKARDVVQKLLIRRANLRMSLKDLLQSEWLRDATPSLS